MKTFIKNTYGSFTAAALALVLPQTLACPAWRLVSCWSSSTSAWQDLVGADKLELAKKRGRICAACYLLLPEQQPAPGTPTGQTTFSLITSKKNPQNTHYCLKNNDNPWLLVCMFISMLIGYLLRKSWTTMHICTQPFIPATASLLFNIFLPIQKMVQTAPCRASCNWWINLEESNFAFCALHSQLSFPISRALFIY